MIFFRSETYSGKATIHTIHIRVCTKTETAMAEAKRKRSEYF